MTQHEENKYDIDDGVYCKRKTLSEPVGEMSALDTRQMVRDAVDDGSFNTPPEVKKTAFGFTTTPGTTSIFRCTAWSRKKHFRAGGATRGVGKHERGRSARGCRLVQ